MSALSVPVLIGSKSLTAFSAIAHDTAHDQYRLRSRRPSVSIKLRRQVREGKKPARPGRARRDEKLRAPSSHSPFPAPSTLKCPPR